MNNGSGKIGTTFLLVGPPASGKSVCAKVAEDFGCTVIGMGDLLRKKIGEGDILIKRYVDEGLYVPSKHVFPVIFGELPNELTGKIICLDGFPRTRAQAEKLVGKLEGAKTRLVVIQIEVDQNICLIRAKKRGRNDDKVEVILARMSEYETNAPALCAYLKRHSNAYHVLNNESRDKGIMARQAFVVIRDEIELSNHL